MECIVNQAHSCVALQLADSSGLVGIAVSHHTVSGMTRAANRPRTHQFEHNGVNGLYKGLNSHVR